jgi:LAO/AO transport system kinase
LSIEEILKGNVRATARMIRRIDDGDRSVFPELAQLFRHAGNSYVIGFTGSPGVGKSTLVDRIVTKFRQDGFTIGVLAIDPSSPFSGGAILGDRIRMQRHFLDDGVFIRSLATRGSFGGLTRSTADAIVVLDAMGKDVVIVETVGVGQDEVDIVHNAHTTVLVTIPGMGDDIQAIKAGLMEIGDIFVVNKADREGAAKTVRELRFMLEMSGGRHGDDQWAPPVLEAVSVQEQGIDEVYRAILQHRAYLKEQGAEHLRRLERTRATNQLMDLIKDRLIQAAFERISQMGGLDVLIDRIVARDRDPYQVSSEILENLLSGGQG